jgi:hypothetical protein
MSVRKRALLAGTLPVNSLDQHINGHRMQSRYGMRASRCCTSVPCMRVQPERSASWHSQLTQLNTHTHTHTRHCAWPWSKEAPLASIH